MFFPPHTVGLLLLTLLLFVGEKAGFRLKALKTGLFVQFAWTPGCVRALYLFMPGPPKPPMEGPPGISPGCPPKS